MLKILQRFKKKVDTPSQDEIKNIALQDEITKLKAQLELFKTANLQLAQQLMDEDPEPAVDVNISDQIKFAYLRCITTIVERDGTLTVPVYDNRLACHKTFRNDINKQKLQELLRQQNNVDFSQIINLLEKLNYTVDCDSRYSHQNHRTYKYATITNQLPPIETAGSPNS